MVQTNMMAGFSAWTLFWTLADDGFLLFCEWIETGDKEVDADSATGSADSE